MSQDQSNEQYLTTIGFEQSTKASWYGKNGWQRVDNDLVNDIRRNDRLESRREHDFRFDMVLLEAKEINFNGRTHLNVQRSHFLWLLERASISISSVGTLFHRDGWHSLTVDNSPHVPKKPPTSLYISMQTPSLEAESPTMGPLSLLLGISAQTNSALCIIITSNLKEANNNIAGALQSNYLLIRTCPLHVLNIFCGELDRFNEAYWVNRHRSFQSCEKKMDIFCYARHKVYTDPRHSAFSSVHAFNMVRRGLVNLDYALDFELSALRFTRDTMAAYQDMQYMPQFSQTESKVIQEKNNDLQTVARLRQSRRQGVEKRAALYVEILNSFTAQNDTRLNLDIAENTRKDSISLRNIAIVTVVFLPITVVSTISGSNALDFEKQKIRGGVSVWKYWWAFLLVAIVLTIAVSGQLFYQEIQGIFAPPRRPRPNDTEQGSDNNDDDNNNSEQGRTLIRGALGPIERRSYRAEEMSY
ncbi:hypothetical protein F4813DRAFT_391065 [Daldinia decipiens]|uniref:uncharacterized protein n=1 Tax=Daldinia decipiens TaxID=326647 RepID=UPI0020C25E09|nr:uncharacterized protein F4813DRAFT_391065 [Daldinia decipiens]KAI1656082.1 hypothetical protein F4813DRAFT_391065 [Daldinia decipiens]